VGGRSEVRKDSLSKNGLKVGMRVSAGQQIGRVSDTSMLHFETYVKGTTDSHRWWKSAKSPPRELLNPTRCLLELARVGLTATGVQPAPASVPSPSPAPSTSKPAAELVPFAQRVLDACEGERLDADGHLGKLTRAALTRFRQKYGLGSGGVIDEATALGLAQRAMEELKQQSMFAQTGSLDARTREELAASGRHHARRMVRRQRYRRRDLRRALRRLHRHRRAAQAAEAARVRPGLVRRHRAAHSSRLLPWPQVATRRPAASESPRCSRPTRRTSAARTNPGWPTIACCPSARPTRIRAGSCSTRS
jgi:hypothetical protein